MTLSSSLLYQTGSLLPNAFILTGPVIGMVTDTTARILIETNIDCTAQCTLKRDKDDLRPVTRRISMERRVPKCFQFDGLEPETSYIVSFDIPAPGLVKSSFMTMPRAWSLMNTPARFGFVGGNNCVYSRDHVDEKSDLWKSLFRMANKGQLDYLIHVGDNVYIDNDDYLPNSEKFVGKREDNRWQTAMALLEDELPVEWPLHYESICDIFKGGYRETWNHPMVKHTLANVPNLMILNDREIRTRFGDSPADYDPYSKEYFLACCAYEAHNLYQRNLFEDYTPQKSPYASTSEVRQAYHFHVFGDIGIMMLDVRAARTFHRNTAKNPEKDDELPLLGHKQWKDIEFALSDTGYFSGCRMLFVVTPTPPALIGESGTMLLRTCGGIPGRAGAWFGPDHIPELSYFLSSLFDWRAKNPGHRELCVVAEGLGGGLMTDILDTRYTKLHDGRLDRLKQLVLGPVAAAGYSAENKKLVSQALNTINSIAPHHQFKHYNVWDNARQYGVIDVYLDYNELHPEYGIVTKFTALVTGGRGDQLTSLKPIDNTFRPVANFSGTFLGMCDPGADRRGFALRPSTMVIGETAQRKYTLLPESEVGHAKYAVDPDVDSEPETCANASMPPSFDGPLGVLHQKLDSTTTPTSSSTSSDTSTSTSSTSYRMQPRGAPKRRCGCGRLSTESSSVYTVSAHH